MRMKSLLLVLLLLVSPCLAGGPKVERLEAPPPESVPEKIRTTLEGQAYAVTLNGQELAHFWLLESLPEGAPGGGYGLNFANIPYGAPLGAVKLLEEWKDYKDLPVPAGVYTLRYAHQPADGNHTGVSFYRDFLLLVPAGSDPGSEGEMEIDPLNALSKMSTGTVHPGVMAVFPIWDGVETTSVVKNEMEQWTLAWKVGDQVLGLVLEGHGEIEGY